MKNNTTDFNHDSTTDFNHDSTTLSNVEQDMDVYDRDGDKIGQVDRVQFGEGQQAASAGDNDQADDQNMVSQLISDIFSSEEELPEELQGRLARHGFVTVNDNPMTRTYYFFPESIDRVKDGAIHLNIPKSEVMYQ